ncbi:MAG: glycosyltransferase [Thermoanaerobaculia bacterium]|nr:glycosyltransferase [Thermoanaerobaculia bacterium]
MSIPATVVIPNLDCPLVDRAVEAVRAQTPALEILVVGRDRPGRLAGAEGVRMVATETALSPAAARNRGVEEARGQALLFTDADCRPQPGWAEALLATLERAPVAGGAVRFDLGGNRWAVADNIASFHEFLADRPREDRTRGPLGTLNLAATREAWRRTGPFDEALPTSEDHDWVLRARQAGLATAFTPDAVVEHAAVRSTRGELERHAAWYGRHFHAFLARHPGSFARGPTWASRGRLAATAPVKALLSAVGIFRRHPGLLPAWRSLPGVVRFKWAWYRAVLAAWPDA